MDTREVFVLGLGLKSPWQLAGQRLNTSREPHTLELEVNADRGAAYPCPQCGRSCKAHDFQIFRWQHLNFFQYHCEISTRVPRTECPEHGVKRARVPWARPGSSFTLLFEEAAMSLCREMPVSAVARHVGVTDKRLWRVVSHYVTEALGRLDLSSMTALALDETASKRGHNYVTVFIDPERSEKPVVFATPGKGKDTVKAFRAFLEEHGGSSESILEVVCDMSKAFLTAAGENFPNASVTVDWFHVVQAFTRAVESVRKAEHKKKPLPKGARWAVLKDLKNLTKHQAAALTELITSGFATATAWRMKEKLRWVRCATSARAARWRLTHFLRYARTQIKGDPLLEALSSAIATVQNNFERILQRWASNYSNARLEAFNGLFKAARARARGYRNTSVFISMIYLIAAPLRFIFNS